MVIIDLRQPLERMKSVLGQIQSLVFITLADDEKFMSSLSDISTFVLNNNLMRDIASPVVTEAILL